MPPAQTHRRVLATGRTSHGAFTGHRRSDCIRARSRSGDKAELCEGGNATVLSSQSGPFQLPCGRSPSAGLESPATVWRRTPSGQAVTKPRPHRRIGSHHTAKGTRLSKDAESSTRSTRSRTGLQRAAAAVPDARHSCRSVRVCAGPGKRRSRCRRRSKQLRLGQWPAIDCMAPPDIKSGRLYNGNVQHAVAVERTALTVVRPSGSRRTNR
jgi:hypothetical protein